MNDYRLLNGDSLQVLKALDAGSVQTCVTSPPYYGLRDYGEAGQLGLEDTPEAFVARLVEVFREVRRVLRDDGTLWLNLGDSYGSGNSGQTCRDSSGGVGGGKVRNAFAQPSSRANCGKPPIPGMHKQLLGIPWRVAFALQADGWVLRSDVIWHKPNPMPESVRDRPTKSHEYLFLLAKNPRYHYDADAVREPALQPVGTPQLTGQRKRASANAGPNYQSDLRSSCLGSNQGSPWRNRRSVWTVATRPYKGAHFATFPPKLIEPCILAGTSAKGCCPACGAPWERVVEVGSSRNKHLDSMPSCQVRGVSPSSCLNHSGAYKPRDRQETGWRPSCTCDAGSAVPCTVLDPFCGSGTTGLVALQHGRRFLGIDLSAAYLELARQRIESALPLESAA